MDDPRRQQSCQAVNVSDAPWRALPRGARPHCSPSAKLTEDGNEAAKAMSANPDIGVSQIVHSRVSPAALYQYIPAARAANTRALQTSVEPSRPPRC